MRLKRRELLTLTAAGATMTLVASSPRTRAAARPSVKAIALDGFTTFDPRPIAALTEHLFPGKGVELTNLWRTRQFEYTWLRTLMGRYADFWHVTEEALVFATRMLRLDLTAEKQSQLMQAWLQIKAWPDVLPALTSLKDTGIRLAFLSNFTASMLDAAVGNAGLEGLFEPHLSTDRVRTFKPAPHAYQMGLDAFGLRREEIVFAAFGGWDVAGAKAFGYPTFWVNRMNAPAEELGVAPDGLGATLQELVHFVLARQ